MTTLISNIIKLKNPNFQMDNAVDAGVILELVWTKLIQLLRGISTVAFQGGSKKIFVGRGVKFFNKKNISFGSFVQLEDHVYVSALGKGQVELGDNVKIGAFSRVITSTSFNDLGESIKIGNNVGMGEFAYLGGAGGLEIGADCIIGQYFSCHPENHNFDNPNELIRMQGTTRKGIKIGKNCWIGSKVTILDGVTIGDNCVIAAGAVVTKSMPANSVIGGVPAKVLKSTVETKVSQLSVVAA